MQILIADDHGIVRAGIRLLLERQSDIEVVAEAADGVEAVDKALATRPDGAKDGLELTARGPVLKACTMKGVPSGVIAPASGARRS